MRKSFTPESIPAEGSAGFGRRSAALSASILLLVLMLAGCGGGGATAPAQDTTRGTAEIRLQFAAAPQGRADASGKRAAAPTRLAPFAGNIPFGAFSVRVTVTNPTTGAQVAPPRLVTRPVTQGQLVPQVTLQYAALPVGPIRVDVAALPNHDGSGTAIAVGTATGQITPLQTTSLSAPMTLTVVQVTAETNRVVIDGSPLQVNVAVSAVDANNQPLDYPLMAVSDDPDIADAAVVSTLPGSVLISAAGVRGRTNITVYEPNSGLSTRIAVEVD